jgi:dihydroxyacetone kinase
MGDKTLLDALVPAIDVLDEAVREGASGIDDPLGRAAAAAAAAAEESRHLVARRGRAAYTGERSVGSLDPGAVAVAVLFQAIHAAWQRPVKEEGT